MFVLKAVDFRLFGRNKSLHKGMILFFAQRAVDIVRRPSIIARREKCMVHIHALKTHQRRRCIVKMERFMFTEKGLEIVCHRIGRQRSCRYNHFSFVRNRVILPFHHGNIGMVSDARRHRAGKTLTIHCQRAAGRHPCLICAGKDQRPQPPQFLLKQPHSILQLIGTQGVGAHQLGKCLVGMRGGVFSGLHLMQLYGNPPASQLPGCFAARQTRTDHQNSMLCIFHHSVAFSAVSSASPLAAVLVVFFAAVLAAFFLAALFGAAFFAAGFFAAAFVAAGFAAAFFAVLFFAAGFFSVFDAGAFSSEAPSSAAAAVFFFG